MSTLSLKVTLTLLSVTTAIAPARLLAQVQGGDVRIALTGDSNLHRKLSVFDDPAYLDFFKRIQTADASFTNLEAVIHPLNIPAAAFAGGTPGISPAWTVNELKWAGFNLLSVANNHEGDYGADGLLANLHALENAGLIYAGAGPVCSDRRVLHTYAGRASQ
jgi:poly-gamma-glutamate capsule biosynthesis protein CapA/YwtB (metallophosphatase superfamily)